MPGVTTRSPALRARPPSSVRPSPPLLASAASLPAQTSAPRGIPLDSTHWTMQGKAEVTEYLGRRCLMLDGGGATANDFELRDGVIDVDVATPAKPRVLRSGVPGR